MKKYTLLFLTDHSTHSAHNSIYNLARAAVKHGGFKKVYIASRGHEPNREFFYNSQGNEVIAIEPDESFEYSESGMYSGRQNVLVQVDEMDCIWLRLPRPIPDGFFDHIASFEKESVLINHPLGIEKTGSKKFLLQFPQLCAPIKLVTNREELSEFAKKHEIVVKPLEDYGGKGIFRIREDSIILKDTEFPISRLDKILPKKDYPVLAMKFLKNVTKGDKRIVVAGDKILLATLRLPPQDSWLCNISQGGSSEVSEVEEEELTIVKTIAPELKKYGVLIYGIDTLEDDEGKRVLSEINTLSVGGIGPYQDTTGINKGHTAVDIAWNYVNEKKSND